MHFFFSPFSLQMQFALFQLAHDLNTDEKADTVNTMVANGKENGINLEDLLKSLLPK